jgi:hypothetical protein
VQFKERFYERFIENRTKRIKTYLKAMAVEGCGMD